jgi:hypothetical protein
MSKVVLIPSCDICAPEKVLEWNMNCCVFNDEMQGIKPALHQARVRCYSCEKEARKSLD